VEIVEHIAAIRREGPLLRAAAEIAGPGPVVPSCPEWTVRDLVRHLGGVHRWATSTVATPRTGPWGANLEEVVGGWPDDQDLLDWFDAGWQALVTTLEQASPDLSCWTFLRAPSPLAMWARRQAHETAMHRVDVELAAGVRVSHLPAPFAADGIDELLTCFITRGSGTLRTEQARTLGVRCDDAEGDWLVVISDEPASTTEIGSEGPDCTLTGRAEDLYLALWSRPEPGALTILGDKSVLDLFLDKVNIRWT
jgi:uncharacterized protein (TIGR03083 family)